MKKTLSILLMLLLLVSGARAEFAPAATALATHWRAGGAVLATGEWTSLNGRRCRNTLGAVSRWLSAARMDFVAGAWRFPYHMTLDDQLLSASGLIRCDGRAAMTLMFDSLDDRRQRQRMVPATWQLKRQRHGTVRPTGPPGNSCPSGCPAFTSC